MAHAFNANFGGPNGGYIGDYFGEREFDLFGLASERMVLTIGEMADRYRHLEQDAQALDLYARAFGTQYVQAMALATSSTQRNAKFLENGGFEIISNLEQLRAQPQAEAPALLLLEADALVLPMQNGAAQVMARVRDAKGTPVAGVTVQFQSNLGSLTPASAVTDADGAASSTFTSSGREGRALVMATANGLQREAAIQLVNPAISAASNVLSVEFGATTLTPGQAVALNAVLRDGAGQPVAGELVTLFGSLGR